jgi:hypothetical protein
MGQKIGSDPKMGPKLTPFFDQKPLLFDPFFVFFDKIHNLGAWFLLTKSLEKARCSLVKVFGIFLSIL